MEREIAELQSAMSASNLRAIPNLCTYDLILLNTSGGKDSQTMLRYVGGLAREAGVFHRLVAVHADLGEMEWEGTKELAETQASLLGIPFIVEHRRTATGERQSLLEHVEARGKWPSSTTRYCTSDHKRGPCGRTITRLAPAGRVLNCFGFRAQESPARAKRPVVSVNKRSTTKRRHVEDWLPIHNWTEKEVWADIRASGLPYHRAYDLGMPRLSCVFCIFAPRAALILAGRHNTDLLRRYADVEKRINHTFRKELSIISIIEAIEGGETADELSGDWNM